MSPLWSGRDKTSNTVCKQCPLHCACDTKDAACNTECVSQETISRYGSASATVLGSAPELMRVRRASKTEPIINNLVQKSAPTPKEIEAVPDLQEPSKKNTTEATNSRYTGQFSGSTASSESEISDVRHSRKFSKLRQRPSFKGSATFDITLNDINRPYQRREFDGSLHGWREWDKTSKIEPGISDDDVSAEQKRLQLNKELIQAINRDKVLTVYTGRKNLIDNAAPYMVAKEIRRRKRKLKELKYVIGDNMERRRAYNYFKRN